MTMHGSDIRSAGRGTEDDRTKDDRTGEGWTGEGWAEAMLKNLAETRGNALDLMEGALAFASFDAPVSHLDPYRNHISQMAADIGSICQQNSDGMARIEALRHVLFSLNGYQGDRENYDDLQNANIIRVMDRRRGLPVALGILMIHLARTQGWQMWGLDFPGHFLLRLDAGADRWIIDPFHEGAVLETPALRSLLKATAGPKAELSSDHYQAVCDRKVLLRLQNNIKIRLIQSRRMEEAAGIIDAMLLLAPDRTALWREAGFLHAHIGNIKTALEALSTFIERSSPTSPARKDVESLWKKLHSQLN